MTKPWRSMELLVRDLEECLGGQQVEIKSPDRIRDKVTGRLREVDVSIRGKVGSANVLVIIECRKRKYKQDTTWLEQVATKKRKVRAQKAIAVSTTPFTAGAVLTAADEDIELRTLEEIGPDDVIRCLGTISYRFEVKRFSLSMKSQAAKGTDRDTTSPLAGFRVDEPVFIRLADGHAMNVLEAFPLYDTFVFAGDRMPLGKKTDVQAVMPVAPGQLGITTERGILELTEVSLQASIERRLVETPARAYRYVDQSGSVIAQGTQVELDSFGVPVVIHIHPTGPSGQPHLTVRRADHSGDRMIDYDYTLKAEDGTLVKFSGVAERPAAPRRRRERR